MDILQNILDSTNIPILSAFLLGLITAISPCPLATNITATAFISKNITDKKKVFLSGFVYALGRAFSYTVLGVIFYFGANQFHFKKFLMSNGEKFLGPLLIILGFVMLNIIKLNFLGKSSFQEKLSEKFRDKGLLGSFLIGIIFALAFCPYSGALYFGALIPLTITKGLYLPIIFAFGTGLPVILFTYLLAFTVGKIGIFYNKIAKIEKVMRFIAGIVFILTGIYYVLMFTGLL
jgi:cytochrome c biogenesis protein CcdA